ncbi:hypothetical protein [Lautropia mirabilis]
MSDTTLIERPATAGAAQSSTTAKVAGAPAPAVASRPVLCFARTATGSAQLKQPSVTLSPQATRLLMLFEEPQTIDELRRIIDEPWLPEALIELERRKLVRRENMVRPAPAQPAASAAANEPTLTLTRQSDAAREAAVRLARQRAQARILFLQQIGRLSTLMIDRIESCQSEAELQRLTPAFADLLATSSPADQVARAA